MKLTNLAIIFVLISTLLLTACNTQETTIVEQPDMKMATFEVYDSELHNPETTMLTFEEGKQTQSMFEKWQERQAKTEQQERWETYMEQKDDCDYEYSEDCEDGS